MKTILTLLLIITLSACTGWRLRGSDGGFGSVAEQSIYLSGDNSVTYLLVQKQLRKNNSITSFASAKQQLIIGEEKWQRRSASVDRSGSTAEYELTLTVNYQISNSDKQLLRGPTDARSVRSYTFDANDIIGKEKEEELIRNDMRRAIARQILQQLQLVQR